MRSLALLSLAFVFLIFPTMLVFVLLMYSLRVQTNKWPKELTPLHLLGKTGLLIISASENFHFFIFSLFETRKLEVPFLFQGNT